jgi:xanthine dehydrogenase FAD-binding subunit
MNLWQAYVSPTSLAGALDALASAPGPAMPIAGGTDLLVDLEQGRHPPAHTLVDLSSVKELAALEVREDRLFIGAGVPVGHVAENQEVVRHARALAEACMLIGGPQVRNVATLGGNVAHALPAADGTIALLALNVVVEIANPVGTRRVPMGDLFQGPGKSTIKHGTDLIVGFLVGLKAAHQASCFRRIMRPQGVALPILNLAVWLWRDGAIIRDIRIAAGPGGPVPWRALEAEQLLRGQPFSGPLLRSAADSLLLRSGFRTSSHRATAEYRRHLAADLLTEAFEMAWGRAAEAEK